MPGWAGELFSDLGRWHCVPVRGWAVGTAQTARKATRPTTRPLTGHRAEDCGCTCEQACAHMVCRDVHPSPVPVRVGVFSCTLASVHVRVGHLLCVCTCLLGCVAHTSCVGLCTRACLCALMGGMCLAWLRVGACGLERVRVPTPATLPQERRHVPSPRVPGPHQALPECGLGLPLGRDSRAPIVSRGPGPTGWGGAGCPLSAALSPLGPGDRLKFTGWEHPSSTPPPEACGPPEPVPQG